MRNFPISGRAIFYGFIAMSLASTALAQSKTQHLKLPAKPPLPLNRPVTPQKKIAPQQKVAPKTDTMTTGAIVRPNLAPSVTLQSNLKNGLDAVYGNNTARAIAIRNAMPQNSLDRHILTWAIGISGNSDVPSTEIFIAATELRDWPGLKTMRIHSERALIRESRSPQAIIQGFGQYRPLSAEGMAALGNALIMTGQSAKARNLVAPWWYTAKLDSPKEQMIIDKVGAALTTEDHLQRMRNMLYNDRIASAQRLAPLARAQSLFNGVVAVSRNEKNAMQKLNGVDKSWRNDPLYLYAQIQCLRRNNQIEEAAKLMMRAPRDATALGDPDAWWVERRVLSRELLDIGKAKLAYQLVAAHSAESPAMAADAEFHAGWYALRFLNDPRSAFNHFSRIGQVSPRPLTLSRGYYWMGRSSEAMGDRGGANNFFRRSAHYGTTYYGQLSASRLGMKGLEIPYPNPSSSERQRFQSREAVLAIQKLEAAGYRDKAKLLYRELGEELTSPGELALLAAMAERGNDHYTSLRIGKSAAVRGLDVGALTHPVGAIPASANINAAGKALSYAIARQESEFRVDAVSSAGAKGLLQLMPATAKSVAQRHGLAYRPESLTSDAAYNATLGAHYLGQQLDNFNGSYVLTFIGYNAGARRASDWMARYGDPRGRNVDDVVDWVERIPFTETRNYVMRVMENYETYKARLTGQADIRTDLVSGRRNQ